MLSLERERVGYRSYPYVLLTWLWIIDRCLEFWSNLICSHDIHPARPPLHHPYQATTELHSIHTMDKGKEGKAAAVVKSGSILLPSSVSTYPPMCFLLSKCKNKTTYKLITSKPHQRRNNTKSKNIVHDLCHVERRVRITSPGKIMLELPPNFSRVVKSEEYMITMNVSSDGEGNVSPVVSKVEKGKCDGDKSIGFCSVCWDQPCGLVFIPCGHVTTCRPCGVQMYLTRRKCPMCRKEIEKINDVFHSGNNANANNVNMKH